MSQPAVSVIIPTYNGRAFLESCLTALQAQTAPPAEIIVVDNGSTDGTCQYLQTRFPAVRVLSQPVNEGYARPCNLGARAATGEWLLFLNNDALPSPECLVILQQTLHDHPAAAVAFAKVRLRHNPSRLDVVGSSLTWTGFLHHVGFLEEDHGQYDHLTTIFSPKGVCYLVRRAAFETVEGFDERFFAYFDETDLFWRLRLAGHEIQFAPTAVAYHSVGETSGLLPVARIAFHSNKNRVRTLIKNLGPGRLGPVLIAHGLCCLAITVGYLLRLRWRNAAAVMAAWGWNLWYLSETLRVRRRVQRHLRRVSDAVLFAAIPPGVDRTDGGARSFWVNPSWRDLWLGLRFVFFRKGLWQQYRATMPIPKGLR